MGDPGTQEWSDQLGCKHSGSVLESVGGFDVIDCAACAYKHVVPLPTAEELESVYRHDYYSTEKPFYIERYLEDKEWWDAVYAARYDFLESHLAPGRRHILDVGSGPGLFLALGKTRGWTVKGIEPSSRAAAHSRDSLGLDIDEVLLDEQTARGLGPFDVLNMGEVLEHLPDPAAMLRLAHGLLADGGLICLIVPNDFNPFQQVLRRHDGIDPWWVAPPHHLNYFNFDSLERLVERCGFEVIHRESTFPIDLFLLMGENYIGNDPLGRRCHRLRKTFELKLTRNNPELLKRWQRSLAEMGLGREILMYGRKR